MDARGHLQTMNNSSSKPSGDAFASLYPAIVQCFTIILLGYVTGRGGWINATHAKGLNTFTSKFALPSLLFSSMATLDWTKVKLVKLIIENEIQLSSRHCSMNIRTFSEDCLRIT